MFASGVPVLEVPVFVGVVSSSLPIVSVGAFTHRCYVLGCALD